MPETDCCLRMDGHKGPLGKGMSEFSAGVWLGGFQSDGQFLSTGLDCCQGGVSVTANSSVWKHRVCEGSSWIRNHCYPAPGPQLTPELHASAVGSPHPHGQLPLWPLLPSLGDFSGTTGPLTCQQVLEMGSPWHYPQPRRDVGWWIKAQPPYL